MNKQSIFRTKHKTKYTVLGNKTLENEEMTFEARGLLCFLLAKPPNWTVVMEHIINSSPAGKYKVARMIGELLKHGYVVRSQKRNTKGQFNFTSYEVYDEPQSNYREVDKPEMDEPVVDKQALQKKQASKETSKEKITTTNDFLIDKFNWPKKASLEDKKSIINLKEKGNVFIIQNILDEVDGSTTEVRTVVGYYRHLLQLYEKGGLEFSKTILSQKKRKNKKLAGESYKKLIEESEKQRVKQLDENKKK